uniref:Uncharacterized protein n=1 Tax=Anguilla anguilla TaxID=7936 RepID=A0A0E9UF19_ANGAN
MFLKAFDFNPEENRNWLSKVFRSWNGILTKNTTINIAACKKKKTNKKKHF